MKNKGIHWIAVLFCYILTIKEVWAFEVPSYIEDPQDVSGNIDIIIEQNTPNRGTMTNAQETTQKTDETIAEYAARLYAEALSIRARLSQKSEADKAKTTGSTNKQEILQNDVKSQVKNIALHLKQIVELETAIVNLQSTQLLVGMDEVSTSKDTSTEGEE